MRERKKPVEMAETKSSASSEEKQIPIKQNRANKLTLRYYDLTFTGFERYDVNSGIIRQFSC